MKYLARLAVTTLLLTVLHLTAPPARAQTTYWGYALSFNGGNDVSVAYNYQLDMTNNYTLECWFKTAVYSQWGGLVDKYQTNGNEGYFIRYRDGNLDLDQMTTSSLNLQPGIWHFVAGVNSNGTRHLYLDGVEQTIAGTADTPASHSGPLCVGVDYSTRYFQGQIDEVRVWNVARSQAQIQADMFQQLTGNEPGLVACYHFDEGSGDIANDAVTNHNGGMLVNGPAWVVSTAPIPFTYTTNNGTITITAYTGYTGAGGRVSIPGTINGLPVTSIGDGAFAYSSVTNVTIPNSVTNIPDFAFYYCTNLASVTIGNSVTSIGDEAFYNCHNLTSVTLGSNVTSIGTGTFAFCASLSSVTIPNSVTNIGEWAFESCSSLTNVVIPDSVTSIGDGAFESCSSLTAINVDPSNPAYMSAAGVLFNNSQSTLIQYPVGNGATSYTISNSVTSIGDGAFESCSSLTNVMIPDSVTSIGEWAFESCSSLTNVVIPNSVTSIGEGAFNCCSSLTSVMIGTKVTSIGTGTFAFCASLSSVTIPNSVTSIGDDAFYDCPLTEVYFAGNAPGVDTTVFSSDYPTIYYLPGTTGWDAFDANSGLSPAVLWNPQAQSFGMRTNGFGFTITGTANIPIVVEACTNLACAAWTPLQTCAVTNGSIYFCDPQGTNQPARFYRIRSP